MTARRYSKSVLLVDDDPADLKLFTRLLTKHGFEVIPTREPDKAMSVLVRGEIGCFITDEMMAVTGHELAKLAIGIRADIRIIFLVPQNPGTSFRRVSFL